MSKTRTDSLKDAIDTINDNAYPNTGDVTIILLSEIAGSLEVIADYMTTKKEGDVDEYTN